MTENRTFFCGHGDCKEPTSGIYCDAHKGVHATLAPVFGPYEGERVRFVWRGIEREGIVSSTTRANVLAVIELKGKRRILRVSREDLLPATTEESTHGNVKV